ncbi:MAG: PIG-L family deacetylase [Lentisphaeraceae bacterium]|nr:PIG-L family deacetylase [Lentisphaeraceae bacterium]
MSETLNKYKDFVANFVRVHKEAVDIELGDFSESSYNQDSPLKVLVFSPHPDDECVVGALPLRLKQELNARVINVAVTLGSNVARKEGRLDELQKACKTLGFEIILPGEKALDGVNLKTKENDAATWAKNVEAMKNILLTEKPQVMFFPHVEDFNSSHIGVNLLLMEAIEAASKEEAWNSLIIETEFWQMMDKPNLMIGLSHEDEATLIYALSAHTEEVQRNPYHLNHPARMLDNVTRGSEVVGGQGGQAVECDFAMIYRAKLLKDGQVSLAYEGGKTIDNTASLQELIDLID